MLAFIFMSNLFSQNNDVVVFAEDPIPFYLVLNGLKQNEKAETNVKIASLNSDRISLKVIFEDETIAPISKNIWLGGAEGQPKSNMIVTYRIVATKKAYKLKWFGAVAKVSAPVVNNQPKEVYQTVPSSAPTQTVVKETVTTTTTSDNADDVTMNTNMNGVGFNVSVNANQPAQPTTQDSENVSFNMSVNVNDNTGFDESANVNMNMNMNDGMGVDENVNMNTNMNVSDNNLHDVETTTYNSTTTTTTTSTTGWTGDTQSTTTNSNSYTVNDCEVQNINSVLNAIENESFKSDRMMIAKQATKNKCLSVDQIKQILEKFTFEDGKLEFAKNAYANCSNKDDYYLLNEAFTFSSSKSELNKYVSNQ